MRNIWGMQSKEEVEEESKEKKIFQNRRQPDKNNLIDIKYLTLHLFHLVINLKRIREGEKR
jgi:hypothetical protein